MYVNIKCKRIGLVESVPVLVGEVCPLFSDAICCFQVVLSERVPHNRVIIEAFGIRIDIRGLQRSKVFFNCCLIPTIRLRDIIIIKFTLITWFLVLMME